MVWVLFCCSWWILFSSTTDKAGEFDAEEIHNILLKTSIGLEKYCYDMYFFSVIQELMWVIHDFNCSPKSSVNKAFWQHLACSVFWVLHETKNSKKENGNRVLLDWIKRHTFTSLISWILMILLRIRFLSHL